MAYVFDQSGECSSSRRESNGNGNPNGNGGAGRIILISGTVGRNGRNLRDDVMSIQDGLNHVTPNQGGPMPPLVVDGFVGPKTVAAIERFQKVHFLRSFPMDASIRSSERSQC